MIDFTLSPSQAETQQAARSFAQNVLKDAKAVYGKATDQKSRFQATRPLYGAAVREGLVKAQVPVALGGTSESLVDAAITLEELFAVESAASITVVATALGLMPLMLAGTPSLHEKYLKPFLLKEGEPLASLMHSEPAGTANWLEKGGLGLQTTARKQGDDWIINGEKLWTSNSAGWDDKGADLACVVCRLSDDPSQPQDPEVDPASLILILLVTREVIAANDQSAYQVLGEPELAGHIATSGPHTRFTEFRVPGENLLTPPGQSVPIVEMAFGTSAALVGAMALGTMRAAFDAALEFAVSDPRGGSKPIIEHQSVADKLIDCKAKIETSRLLLWKSVHTLDNPSIDWKVKLDLALQTKIYVTDCAVDCVVDAMKAVGMKSYANDTSFPRLLNDAMCYPLFDGGNIGLRRRQLQDLMAEKDYYPWAATYPVKL
ncbi:acyl-CoA dehydrogenase/oxidase [Ilyonectria robusta]|uniref:acyl-CoA dehydrogenase/oxidase n=1 Tax=Ilyonectria robusta TaxID=1079257 RepID=UPI001E8D2FDE|nr:acyl-CoA dehydrogenase/oxidase [Ilyonectria robusta]KAH8729867.1 acyl-CoA dehydrogenase/oxidase [Ilyonectria robusta]